VIDYETFCKIHDCNHRQGLTIAQTARSLELHRSTVATWLARARFSRRRSQPRPSKLDPFEPSITRLLDTRPYSAHQIFQRTQEVFYILGVSFQSRTTPSPQKAAGTLRGLTEQFLLAHGFSVEMLSGLVLANSPLS
jgi:hypothetical protein